jgi:3-oxoacyl-[acyl-carrier-protein] synthase II
MERVFITDAAVVTSLGATLSDTWQKLMAGGSGIGKIDRFDTRNYLSDSAAWIPDLVPGTNGSMLATLVTRLVSQLGPLDRDTLLFTATTKSCIDLIDSPGQENDLLCSSMARYISQRLNLADRGINISAACASSTIAIAKAAQAIALGRAQSALVCSMDLVTEFVFSGFSALRAMSPEPAKPFDRDRRGLTLGEGAGALVLTSETRANEKGLPPLAEISGWGISGDASHITAPDREGAGLVRAITKALECPRNLNQTIGAINAHGTGTVYNDAMELTAFKHVFGDRVPPINSLKGALGHTLGAGGGIETALGIKMLDHQVLPPTVGLSLPEPGAEGLVSNQPMDFKGDFLLTTNSGFGGINAALVLKRRGSIR